MRMSRMKNLELGGQHQTIDQNQIKFKSLYQSHSKPNGRGSSMSNERAGPSMLHNKSGKIDLIIINENSMVNSPNRNYRNSTIDIKDQKQSEYISTLPSIDNTVNFGPAMNFEDLQDIKRKGNYHAIKKSKWDIIE